MSNFLVGPDGQEFVAIGKSAFDLYITTLSDRISHSISIDGKSILNYHNSKYDKILFRRIEIRPGRFAHQIDLKLQTLKLEKQSVQTKRKIVNSGISGAHVFTSVPLFNKDTHIHV